MCRCALCVRRAGTRGQFHGAAFKRFQTVTGGTESVLPVPAMTSVQSELELELESSYLRPGLVSVSDALFLGVLTLVMCISVNSKKQKEVSPRKPGARLRVQM